MDSKIIKFHSCHSSNYLSDKYMPAPVRSHIPDWYLQKDKHVKLSDGRYPISFWKDKDGKTEPYRQLSWKSCPAILDIFMTGYYLFTPCDIEIKISGEYRNEYDISVSKEYEGHNHTKFCSIRREEEGFPTPYGYSPVHLVWRPNWYPQVPEGYTVLFTHPININNLPFRTISGFVDYAQEIVGPGNLPFFIQENWEGIIPAGTPYAQLIPIRNESWNHEIINNSPEEIEDFFKRKHKEDIVGPSQTKYKQRSWLKKNYE